MGAGAGKWVRIKVTSEEEEKEIQQPCFNQKILVDITAGNT